MLGGSDPRVLPRTDPRSHGREQHYIKILRELDVEVEAVAGLRRYGMLHRRRDQGGIAGMF